MIVFKTNIKSKLWESVFSIFPIFLFVLLLSLLFAPLNSSMLLTFTIASALLFLGMFLFSAGAETSMIPIGENIGSSLSKSRKLIIFIVTSFVLGFAVTIAEPDLAVFASQILGIDKLLFMVVVALGSAVFVVLAILRILFLVPMKWVLMLSYGLVIVLMFFVPSNFLPIAFDAGGVTTGPISTPFLLAFCIGVSAVRSSKTSLEDSFGLIALASIGPVLFVMILSLFIGNGSFLTQSAIPIATVNNFSQMMSVFWWHLLKLFKEVGIIILAILLVFLVFQKTMLHLPKVKIKRILVGIAFTYFGIVIFLTGASVGFLPVANLMGFTIASSYSHLLLYPIVVLFGLCTVIAEPAIHVLVKKVFEISGGTLSKKMVFGALALSSALAMGIGMIKLLFGIPFIAIILPCYLLAVGLSFFTPQIFVSIAFDSGGVASGAMATCFLLPFIIGVQTATSSLPQDAFETIALIAVVPLIVIQALGIAYKVKSNKQINKQRKINIAIHKIEIIEFGG